MLKPSAKFMYEKYKKKSLRYSIISVNYCKYDWLLDAD